MTWTGTFTPTDDIEDTTNVDHASARDLTTIWHGNAPLAGDHQLPVTTTIDTKEPVITGQCDDVRLRESESR